MTFHLFGWTESQDSAPLVPVAAMADQALTISGDDVRVPSALSNLGMVYAVGVSLTQVQLSSPSLRRTALLDVEPLDVTAEPISRPPILEYWDAPIPLRGGENLQGHAAEDGAGATRENILAAFIDQIDPVPAGPRLTVRVTNTSTLGTFQWSNGTLTFSQNLDVGSYAIIGARFQSAGLIAFRFVFVGGGFRPGGIGFDADIDVAPARQRQGGLGSWGEFNDDQPPSVDFLSVSADTSQVGHLDLVRVSEQRAGT